MGVAGKRRPPLPAPTDSSIGAFDRDDEPESPSPVTFSDLETNLTTRTDKTHYSIPEDGSPLVINTDKLRAQPKNLKLREKSKGNQSQNSLLIEYFEGDQEDEHGNRKPSVRVRVTPSSKKKEGSGEEKGARGSVRITERAKGQSTGHSREIDLGSGDEGVLPLHYDNDDISSLAGSDLTAAPIELNLRNRGTAASAAAGEASRGLEAYDESDEPEESRLAPINMSEISSMPPDSMLATELGIDSPTKQVSRRRSRSLDREYELGEEEELEKLKPSRQRSRSLSRERLVARKAVEKFERDRKHKEKEREGKPRRSKSRSASNEYLASTSGKTRRKSSKSYDREDDASNPSLLTGSNLSGYSAQSGQSASSFSKNPKLLQTVEDAIRRLILPEITALKNEQKSHRRSERYDDELSSNASSVRSDERSSSRRVSSGKSGPKLKLNGDTIKSSRGSRRSAGKGSVDSLTRQFEQGASEETIVRDDKTRRRSKDKSKDLAATAAVAGLTAAALRSKDSAASIERRERRKKRSKSHSRSGSRAESRSESRADSVEDVFNKHDVPPMPLVGGLTDSDLTRESILSERTSTPTHERNREVRDLVKDASDEPSLREASSTPTRHMSPGLGPDDGYDGEGYGHSVHLKKEPLSSHMHEDYLDEEEEEEDEGDYAHEDLHSGYPQDRPYMPIMGMYSGANYSGPSFGYQRRGLSPIQSVASFEERGEPPPEHMRHQQSLNSISSVDKGLHEEVSMDSVSSATADNIKRKSMRPKSVNLETPRDTLHGHTTPGGVDVGMLGQDIRRLGANAEYIESPHRAESAVASLMEPSTIGERSNLSYNSNEQYSPNKRYSIETDPHRESIISQDRNLHTPERSSPLKRELHRDDIEGGGFAHHQQHRGLSGFSPSRDMRSNSATSSPFDPKPEMHRTAMPNMGSPMPEIGMYDDDEDLETNPSEIRDDPWEHKEPQQPGSAHDSLRAAANNMLLAAGVMGAGAAVAQHEKALRSQSFDKMDLDSPRHSESPGVREIPDSRSQEISPRVGRNIDSGYVSGAPAMSPPSDGSITPEAKQPRGLFQSMDIGGGDYAEDPFTTPKRERPTTADSDAMPSPLYDAATGRGMDRIKNQDIVALMDHLTVRDAQRNARDTEILVTLVRSAAEMRNSFEDMKRIMATQEERALDANSRQHMETRKAINGPRAMPGKNMSSSRAMSAPDVDADDIPSKKRNIFRKALRGLGGGNKQELGNIENMLMQLLDEVADIKAAQQMPQSGTLLPPKTSSGLTSYEQLRDATQLDGHDLYYSTAQQQLQQQQQQQLQPLQTRGMGQNDAGYSPSNSSSYRAMQQDRRGSSAAKMVGANRVSTVHEDDEEEDSAETPLDEREQDILGNEEADAMLTPTREFRGVSVATGAPQTSSHRQSLSADNTPNKTKRGSSSFFPKISRWSKTTASSVPGLDQTPRQEGQSQFSQQHTPSKTRDQRPVSALSRSASDLNEDYDVRNHYDPLGDDRLRSKTSLSNHSASREVRPPSPLIPSTVSEKPTYSAHRDSKDLQHPQPRTAPTSRYQNHLESEARGWINAAADSPSSDVMGNNPVLSRFGGRERGDRHSGVSTGGAQGAGELGTIAENGSANGGPPRPPKVKDEGPLVPPKVPVDQQSPPSGSNVRTVSFASDRMAQIIGNPQQGRKPSGPRPITRTGSASPASGTLDAWKKHHIPLGANQLPEDDESETF